MELSVWDSICARRADGTDCCTHVVHLQLQRNLSQCYKCVRRTAHVMAADVKLICRNCDSPPRAVHILARPKNKLGHYIKNGAEWQSEHRITSPCCGSKSATIDTNAKCSHLKNLTSKSEPAFQLVKFHTQTGRRANCRVYDDATLIKHAHLPLQDGECVYRRHSITVTPCITN